MLDQYDSLETEVLVVGSGGAGSFAALGAEEEGAQVLVLDRGVFTRSGATIMGGHTCCAALSPADSPKQHFEDTIAGGRQISNRQLVETFVNDAPKRIREVDAYGAGFLKEDSGDFWLVSSPSGHSVVRSVHYGFRTGPAIMRGLRKELRRRGIKALDNALMTSLLTRDGRVVGATALDLLSGRLVVCKSKAIVLAAGGIGQLYAPRTTGPLEAGGDPLGMAYSVGAELVDMEFVQFLPAQIEPALRHISVTLANLPGWRSAIRERTRLVNAEGDEFLHRYDPEKGLDTTRDVQARAIYDEIQAGRGTSLGGVYLDMTRVPEDVLEQEFGARFPGSFLKRVKKEGYVLSERPIQVSIHAHYLMGGLKINERGESTVEGLFGAGEVTGGVHGANRLGGNALSEIMVFGRIAGVSAAQYAKQIPEVSLDMTQVRGEQARLYGYFEQRGDSVGASEVRNALQECMWKDLCVRRDGTGLARALGTITRLRADLDRVVVGCAAKAYNTEWMEAIALAQQLDVAEAVTRAALERRESRGAHFRDDYPVQDDENWCKTVVLRRTDSGMEVLREPVVDGRFKSE